MGRPEGGKSPLLWEHPAQDAHLYPRFVYVGVDMGIPKHIPVMDYIFLKYIEIRRGNILVTQAVIETRLEHPYQQ